jgi:long-chain acyl-CoA synthetase
MTLQYSDALQRRIRRTALGDVIHRSARRFGERTALIDGERRVSYRDLDVASNRFAHHLLARGLKSGDRVGMLCVNSVDMVVAALGIHKAGLVWVPINHALAPEPIDYILEHAEIGYMVIDVAFHARPDLAALLSARRIVPVLAAPSGEPAPAGVQTVSAASADGSSTLPEVEIDDDQLAFVMYTSGTTGRQKGVMHSHASGHAALMSNAIEYGISPRGDVWSGVLPMFHIGQYSILMSVLLAGGTQLIQRGFDPGAVLDAIERHRVTKIAGLPMMYAAMLGHPTRAQRDLSSLQLCIYAMAPMSKTLLLQLLDHFCPNFALVSGQTEVYTGATVFEPHEQRNRFGAYWGVATVVDEVAVMADDGRLLGANEIGEIVFRGPNVMLGYYKDPQATAAAQRHGWHHTGDLGMLDDDGQLLFLDRLKDMIKTGGENVPSIKVEEVLLRHPAVLNAAAVGLPHERWGEAITAFVTLKPGAQATSEQVIAHCKEHLGGFEVPKDVVLLDALPMTSTGKVQKFELRKGHLEHYDRG